MRVIVLNFYSRNSLAVVKALAPRASLIGGAVERTSYRILKPDRLFRYPGVETVFRHRPPLLDPEGFCTDIVAACQRYGANAVIATGTTVTNQLSFHKKRIEHESGTRVCVESFDKLQPLADKWLTYGLAAEQGIPIPDTVLLDGPLALDNSTDLRFPIVIKPRNSFAAIGVRFVASPKELTLLFDASRSPTSLPLDGSLMAQERIEGELHDVTLCAYQGEPTSLLTQRRRQSLYDFGGGGIVNITTFEPEIMAHAKRIVKAMRWNGPAMFDFIRDRMGYFRLLECNPKIWGTTWLTVTAGQDVPAQMLEIFAEQRRPKPSLDYPVGLEYRWLFPECLYHWQLPPRKLGVILKRMRNTFHSPTAIRREANLRLRDIPHLLGIVFDRAEL